MTCRNFSLGSRAMSTWIQGCAPKWAKISSAFLRRAFSRKGGISSGPDSSTFCWNSSTSPRRNPSRIVVVMPGLMAIRALAWFVPMPIWWRSVRFSSRRAEREGKTENNVAKSVVRERSTGEENYERRILPVRSDLSRFSPWLAGQSLSPERGRCDDDSRGAVENWLAARTSVRVRSGCDRYAIRMAFLSCRCHLQVSRDLGHSRVGSEVIFPNSSHGSGDAYSYSRQLAIFPSTSRTTKQPPRVSICQTERTLGRRDVSFPNEASSVPPARTPLAHAFRRFLSDFWNQNCPTTWSTLGARQGPSVY